MRTPVMAGNWKMFKNSAETSAFFQIFTPLVAQTSGREIVICPPFVNLTAAIDAVRDSTVEIGAQNLHWKKEGAFTGEVSARMLSSIGARWVLIGHSERRQFFGDTDQTVLEKTLAALEAGLRPIVCVGELLDERESGRTHLILASQLAGSVAALTPEQFSKIAIAYEPVWAIGTGKTATPEMAADAHQVIREQVGIHVGSDAASQLRILYGGSVKPDNIDGLMTQQEIDGVLVGGASLDPIGFAKIVNYSSQAGK